MQCLPLFIPSPLYFIGLGSTLSRKKTSHEMSDLSTIRRMSSSVTGVSSAHIPGLLHLEQSWDRTFGFPSLLWPSFIFWQSLITVLPVFGTEPIFRLSPSLSIIIISLQEKWMLNKLERELLFFRLARKHSQFTPFSTHLANINPAIG